MRIFTIPMDSGTHADSAHRRPTQSHGSTCPAAPAGCGSVSGSRLLVVMTLACILLGTWVSRSIRQRNALAGLDESGADFSVYYDYELDADGNSTLADLTGPTWLRELLGIDFFATATAIDINNGATDASLAWIKQFPDLHVCELHQSPEVTDEGISQLAAARGLKKLGLYNLEINGAGLGVPPRLPIAARPHDMLLQQIDRFRHSHVGSIANLRAFSMQRHAERNQRGLRSTAPAGEVWRSSGSISPAPQTTPFWSRLGRWPICASSPSLTKNT